MADPAHIHAHGALVRQGHFGHGVVTGGTRAAGLPLALNGVEPERVDACRSKRPA
jgi:hypothetical protein